MYLGGERTGVDEVPRSLEGTSSELEYEPLGTTGGYVREQLSPVHVIGYLWVGGSNPE